MKKITLILISATSLFLFSTHAYAFSVSVGIPLSYTISDDTVAESDGTSGYLIGVQLPFLLGLGMDSYETKIKGTDDMKLTTDFYNIFYQLPVPIVNLVLGLGFGNQNIECTGCDFTKGSATQWYTSIGMPIIPFFDIHLSYRSITSKNVANAADTKFDLSGNATGVGLAFNF